MIYIIKILGTAFMIASGYFFGKSMQQKLKDRHQLLNTMSEAIYYLKTKICSEDYPLPEALKETHYKYFNSKNSVFILTAEKIENKIPAEEAWISSLCEWEEKVVFTRNDKEVIENAGSLLGLGDVQVQKDNLNKLTEELKKSSEEAFAKLNKEGPLYIKVGLAITLIIAVVLW